MTEETDLHPRCTGISTYFPSPPRLIVIVFDLRPPMKTHPRVLLGPRWNLPDNSHLRSFIVTRMTKPGPRATRTFLQQSEKVAPGERDTQ